jgi:multiple sugar transport system substrate-binding protein
VNQSDNAAHNSAPRLLGNTMKTPLSRRTVLTGGLTGAALFGLSGLLAACTPAGATSTGSGGGAVELTHWDWFVSQEPWVKNEIALFQKANSGVTVNRTLNQFDQFSNLITLAQRSKTMPDTYMIPYTPDLPTQVAGGWLTPLNKYATADWVKTFPAYSFVEGVNMFDGKIYTAPVTGAGPSYQLYINNKVFKDAGLVDSDGKVKIPKTWDEVGSFAATINQKSNGSVYGLGMGDSAGSVFTAWLNTFVQAAGSPAGFTGLDYRTGRYTFGTDRNYEDVLSLFKDWYDKEYFHPSSLSITDEVSRVNFASGQFGMIVAGSYAIAPWVAAGFTDFSATTLIGPDEERAGYFYRTPGGMMIGVSADTKHPQEAFDWFSWWGSKDAGARLTQKYGIDLSIYPDNNDASKIESKQFAEYAALADLVRLMPSPTIRNPDAAKVKLSTVTPAIGDIMVGTLTGQISDVGGALKTLGDQSDAALDASIQTAVSGGAKVSRDDYTFADWDITKDYAYSIPEYPTL